MCLRIIWPSATPLARDLSPKDRPHDGRRGVDARVIALIIVFWASAGLLVFAQVGYPLFLALLLRIRRALPGDRFRTTRPPAGTPTESPSGLPMVSIIVPAYAEETVIAGRVTNLRSLDYPSERFEVIVSCDGATDLTAERARGAGADLVLEQPREGKVRTQDAAVAVAKGEILAFGDANTLWDRGALRALVAALEDPAVGYVCGLVTFVNDGGTNQEGLYWRYEMVLRRLESDLRSITAGNGAIYATRRDSYIHVDPVMGHDLSFPFNMVKRGLRAVYEPRAMATEKMVPSIEGEFARKRRFMSHMWPIVLRGGLLSVRGYDPLYALMIFSHRILRYASPGLHVLALATNLALITHGWVYVACAVVQLGVLAAAVAAPLFPARPLLIARYYVLTTAAVAAGLWDWLLHPAAPGWEPVQEIR
jgi:cellulose synthase/poly-beta-1,6-N-acetylglucosamine synthase-like glycosyltransferase